MPNFGIFWLPNHKTVWFLSLIPITIFLLSGERQELNFDGSWADICTTSKIQKKPLFTVSNKALQKSWRCFTAEEISKYFMTDFYTITLFTRTMLLTITTKTYSTQWVDQFSFLEHRNTTWNNLDTSMWKHTLWRNSHWGGG